MRFLTLYMICRTRGKDGTSYRAIKNNCCTVLNSPYFLSTVWIQLIDKCDDFIFLNRFNF